MKSLPSNTVMWQPGQAADNPHLWKADVDGIELACAAAGLEVRRLETVDLYALGIAEAFPSCRGMVAKLEASRAA